VYWRSDPLTLTLSPTISRVDVVIMWSCHSEIVGERGHGRPLSVSTYNRSARHQLKYRVLRFGMAFARSGTSARFTVKGVATMSHKTPATKYHAIVNEKCRQIRRGWSDSERKLRELQASLAQSRLVFSILHPDMSGCLR
jgi:hypothetical protein